MRSFREWMDDKVFPPRPAPLNNPEGKQTMVRVERHSNYTPQKGLDGGDVFFFDTWEEALEWMKVDYYENSGGWSMTRGFPSMKFTFRSSYILKTDLVRKKWASKYLNFLRA